MSTLSQIRSRLVAVKNIKQITTSMEMVASARFRKAKDKAGRAQFYITKMREILENISGAAKEFKHPLFVEREVKKTALVVISSDRGLCGAYNATVFAEADRYLKNQPPDKVTLILIGKKAVHYYQKRNWPVDHMMVGWSGKITLPEIKTLSEKLVNDFLAKKFDQIHVVYTKFISLMQRVVRVEKFLPIAKPEEKRSYDYIFEPAAEELFKHILPRYCLTKIESMLNEAYASELAARIFAMKAAAKNAQEMMETLTLERNKMRQTSITRELLETTATTRE